MAELSDKGNMLSSGTSMTTASFPDGVMNVMSGKKVKNSGYFCSQDGCDRCADNINAKPFTSLIMLKQHYKRLHDEKPYPCKKCGKKFVHQKLTTKHETICGVKYVCSCNIAFFGRRGFMEHIKRSKHEIPEGLKEYLHPKQKTKQVKFTGTLVKNRKTPVPILPKSLKDLKCSILLPERATRNQTGTNSVKKCVIYPKNAPSINLSTNGPSGSKNTLVRILPVTPTFRVLPVVKPTEVPGPDALSVAVQASGIKSSENRHTGTETPLWNRQNSVIDSKSQTSQTRLTVAQDSSCQTEDFLAWLERESFRGAGDVIGGSDISGVNISTQTLLGSPIPFEYALHHDISNGIGNRPATVQIETQTDDWASDLLQHGLLSDEACAGASKCPAPDQAFDPVPRLVAFNDNNNNNVVGFAEDQSTQLDTDEQFYFGDDPIMSEHTSSIQTQTTLSPLNSHVMTQTSLIPQFCDAAMSASLFDFLTHTETQTEKDFFQESIVTTAHTQTALTEGDDLLSDLLNIETQTEF